MPDLHGAPTSTYDIVVIGAGSAGCAIARRLVDAGLEVALIEAGEKDANPAIFDPNRMFELANGPEDWAFSTVPQESCDGRSIECPRGRVLGGSSSINAMIYARGSRHDYDNWAHRGNPGWAYEDVLPLFRRSEDFDRGESEYHGAGGPLHVLSDYERHPVIAAMVEASSAAGVPRTGDYNGAQLEGVDFIQLNLKDGQRHSAAAAFLRPVAGRPNLTVLTGALARELVFEGERCVGVRIERDGVLEEVRADLETVLAAGAIGSPHLLMLSGIGPAAALGGVGVEARVDLPGVGENLQDHLCVPVVYEAAVPLPPPVAGTTQWQAVIFSRSRPGLPGPDLQTMFAHLPWNPAGVGPSEGFSFVPILVRPASVGRLGLISSDPAVAPSIDPRYLSSEADLKALVAAIEQVREVAAGEALTEWRGLEAFPGPDVRGEEALAAYVRATASTIYHHCGTCKMGTDGAAVVDPELKVHGLEGLRIADASIMPSVPSANTHAPSVMIGERASDLILAAAGAAPDQGVALKA